MSFQYWMCIVCCFIGNAYAAFWSSRCKGGRLIVFQNWSLIGLMMSEVFQLAVERPLAGHLKIVDVGVGNIGRRAGIKGGDGLGIMSCTGYCDGSTFTPVSSNFLIAANSASS
jgi:hypothetical protein